MNNETKIKILHEVFTYFINPNTSIMPGRIQVTDDIVDTFVDLIWAAVDENAIAELERALDKPFEKLNFAAKASLILPAVFENVTQQQVQEIVTRACQGVIAAKNGNANNIELQNIVIHEDDFKTATVKECEEGLALQREQIKVHESDLARLEETLDRMSDAQEASYYGYAVRDEYKEVAKQYDKLKDIVSKNSARMGEVAEFDSDVYLHAGYIISPSVLGSLKLKFTLSELKFDWAFTDNFEVHLREQGIKTDAWDVARAIVRQIMNSDPEDENDGLEIV